MKQTDIPIWERYTLTIEEASKYFRIGENKLRRLAEENKNANWLIMNGNRIQNKGKEQMPCQKKDVTIKVES